MSRQILRRSEIGRDLVSHVFSLGKRIFNVAELIGSEPEKRRRTICAPMVFQKNRTLRGFEVTMDRSACFTRDLYLCYEQFAQLYPEWSKPMYQVLANCLNGEDSPVRYEQFVALLARESARLLAL